MKVTYGAKAFTAERKIHRIEEGLFLFRNDVSVTDTLLVPHLSGPTSILSQFLVESGGGTIEYGKHSFPIRHGAFLYLPKNRHVLLKTASLRTTIVNYCSADSLCEANHPFYFETEPQELFSGSESIRAYLAVQPKESFSDEGISSVSLNLKKYIDEVYREDRLLGDFAGHGLTPGTLTYHFKRDFGLTPKEYWNRARVIASMYDLVNGKPADRDFKRVPGSA